MTDPVEIAGHLVQSATLLGNHLAGPVKAMLYCIDDPSLSMTLQFNPSNLRIDRGISVVSGDGDTYAGFRGSAGKNDTLNMDLWLDQSEATGAEAVVTALLPYTFNVVGKARSIESDMKKLYALTIPGSDSPDLEQAPRQPVVVFLWNDLRFTGVISMLTFDVKHFDILGSPVRASVSFQMEGRAFYVTDDPQKVNEPTESPEAFPGGVAVPELAYKAKTAVRKTALRVLNRLR